MFGFLKSKYERNAGILDREISSEEVEKEFEDCLQCRIIGAASLAQSAHTFIERVHK